MQRYLLGGQRFGKNGAAFHLFDRCYVGGDVIGFHEGKVPNGLFGQVNRSGIRQHNGHPRQLADYHEFSGEVAGLIVSVFDDRERISTGWRYIRISNPVGEKIV